MNQLHLLWNVVCHRVQFFNLFYLFCTRSLSAVSFGNQATHTISLRMIPTYTIRVFPQIPQLSIVWKTVLKMSLSGWMKGGWRRRMIKLSSLPLFPSLRQFKSPPMLLLCPSLVLTYHSLSLFEISVSLWMKHSPWMSILNTCAVLFSVSYADLAKSAPSSPLMLPTNSLFLSYSQD